MLRLILVAGLLLNINFANAQKKKQQTGSGQPKLVVGIVVDQMRQEYLQRFQSKFGENGFKRLQREGFQFRNHHYEYFPTYTAPGHASIYTGTTPASHGIVGNDWFVEETGKSMYCVEDSSVKTVGSNSRLGEMSPRNLLSNTITDQLRLSTMMKAKVVSISIKDRGAILPGGHFGKAFWFDESIGGFITSTHYSKTLPEWMETFNQSKPVEKYLSQPWNTLLPIDQYTESLPDDNPWEGKLRSEDKAVFPRDLPKLRKLNGPGIIRDTPFGNNLLFDAAVAAINGENLGKGTATDFLALSFSTPDYMGHRFGPHSVEVQDMYLRLDLLMAELLTTLDRQVGKGNYLLFLTADHGAEDHPGWLASMGFPVNYFDGNILKQRLRAHLAGKFGDSLVTDWNNQQVYLDRQKISDLKLDLASVEQETAGFLQRYPGIAHVFTASALQQGAVGSFTGRFVQNGFFAKRSGSVTAIFQPGWMEYYRVGTTHGSPWANDTHVPMLFFGYKVPPGSTTRRTHIADIAPTLSMILDIRHPNAASGTPMNFD